MTALVDILRALADPTRLRIAALVQRQELAIGELSELLDQSQPRVSRHVGILIDAHILKRRREGSWVYLSFADTAEARLTRTLFDSWDGQGPLAPTADADSAGLAEVHRQREIKADAFFAAHAEEWDAIRSLHAPEAAVEAAIDRALDLTPDANGAALGRLLDVGTGTGRMIEILGHHATEATGLDRSPEMLRMARARLGMLGGAVHLLQGDFMALPFGAGQFDTIILHQVLHFARSPEAVITECARVLAPAGRVLIVDFAPHDRDALRTEMAHVRLGFDDDQMRAWFGASGLALDKIDALPGDTLTVKLWRGTRLAREETEKGADHG